MNSPKINPTKTPPIIVGNPSTIVPIIAPKKANATCNGLTLNIFN